MSIRNSSSSKPQTVEARSGDLSDQLETERVQETPDQTDFHEPVRLPTMGSLMSGLRGFRSAKKAEEPAVAAGVEKTEETEATPVVAEAVNYSVPLPLQPEARREGVLARERLIERGITFDLPRRLTSAEALPISSEALRVLACCPQGGLSTDIIGEMLTMESDRVRENLAALEANDLVTLSGNNASTASMTSFGVRTVDFESTQGNSIEATLGLVDLTLAAANRRFANGDSDPVEVLQAYTTALSRASQPRTRVDVLDVVTMTHLPELVWMVQGLEASRIPTGFDDLAKRLAMTFPDELQPMVAPLLRKMSETQSLFNLTAEMEGRTGNDLLDFVSRPSTYHGLNHEAVQTISGSSLQIRGTGLSTMKTASLLALKALEVDAGLLGERPVGLGASPNNAARIACAVIEGTGQGARPWNYQQFMTMLDPAVGALAATSELGQEILGERLRLNQRESRSFISTLSRPILNQFEGNVDAATKVLAQIAEQTRIPFTESEQGLLRADLLNIRDMDKAMTAFASSLAVAFQQHPDQARDHARTVSIEASAAGVDGALRLYTFLANTHPTDAIEDLSMACLAARHMTSDPVASSQATATEKAEAAAFTRAVESFLMAVGGISPLYNPEIIDLFQTNLKVFIANSHRSKKGTDATARHEISHLRALMTPQGQPGIWASTPEHRNYHSLTLASFLEATGLQRPEIRTVLSAKGLLAWADDRGQRFSRKDQPQVEGGQTDNSQSDHLNPLELLANLGITVGHALTPEGGWTKETMALEVAKHAALTESEGSIWLQGGKESLFLTWDESTPESLEACTEAVLAAAIEHRGKVTLAIHTDAPGFERLASKLKENGQTVQISEIGHQVALASAENRMDLPSEEELLDADQTISQNMVN